MWETNRDSNWVASNRIFVDNSIPDRICPQFGISYPLIKLKTSERGSDANILVAFKSIEWKIGRDLSRGMEKEKKERKENGEK